MENKAKYRIFFLITIETVFGIDATLIVVLMLIKEAEAKEEKQPSF